MTELTQCSETPQQWRLKAEWQHKLQDFQILRNAVMLPDYDYFWLGAQRTQFEVYWQQDYSSWKYTQLVQMIMINKNKQDVIFTSLNLLSCCIAPLVTVFFAFQGAPPLLGFGYHKLLQHLGQRTMRLRRMWEPLKVDICHDRKECVFHVDFSVLVLDLKKNV